MLKATLRHEMLQKRRGYPPEEVAVRSQQICRQFFSSFDISQVRTMHLFLPIVAKNEVNTWFIIEHLRRDFPEVAISVPVTDMSNQTLSHHLLTPDTILIANQWGISEPREATPVTEQAIDMVLVPLLAFDLNGHRVGYGKGFYDRFLALCRSDVITVGLSLEDSVQQISDVHEGDVTLHFAVTPEKVYRFR